MTDNNSVARKEMLAEIENRNRMGNKKFHSETSIQQFEENEEGENSDETKDPGATNTSVMTTIEEKSERRRTMSQPGPISSNQQTATAARTARRRALRNVMYADMEKNDSTDRLPKFISNRDEESFPSTPRGDSSPSPLPYTAIYRNGDIKSLSSYRGGMTPRKRSVATMDAQSLQSIETHAPAPTSPEDNARLTSKYLTLILSCMYAVMLVTLGLILYITDPFIDSSPSLIYSITLLTIGTLYQLFLIFDIARYKSIALKNQKIKGRHEANISDFFKKQEEEISNGRPGDRTPESIGSQMWPSAVLISQRHDYCFSHGRHSGSFYLKLGASAFALGHLVHSMLLITVQLGYVYDENLDNDLCVNIFQLVVDIWSPLYCFLQLYFIFKYSNVLILRGQGLAHFGFMHMIGSSLCFWIATIVRETILALTIYANSKYGNSTYGDDYSYEQTAVAPSFDVSDLYNEKCIGSDVMTAIIENFSPYLYPFAVEFNILIVAVYYIIWSHVGHCESEDHGDSSSSIENNRVACKIPTANEENDYTSNIVIYADCHASNKGWFMGLLVLVIVAGMLILGFVFSNVGGNFLETGYLLSNYTQLGLHIVLFIGAVVASFQTKRLDINENPVSLLDDILLFICLPAFFMETFFSLVATINILNIVKSIDVVLMTIQVIVQTGLLVDGLRRCSNSRKLRRTKPGRELLMLLLISNVAMWLFNTFSYKSPESLDERYEFYGKIMWSILGHVSLPLIMFYRFHSSVCFADMWDAAYKPGSDH